MQISEKEVINSLKNIAQTIIIDTDSAMHPKEAFATRPNQAAAAIEHVVVRGMDNGNMIRTKVVVNDPNLRVIEDTSILDMVHRHHPSIVGLYEPKVSGSQADDICCKFGFRD